MIEHLSSMLKIFSSQMADISLSEISMMEDRLPLRREKLRFLMESRDIAKSRMHACKNLAPQMLYLLPSLLHEARFPSSEEQKNLQMEAWYACIYNLQYLDRAKLQTKSVRETRTTRKTRHCKFTQKTTERVALHGNRSFACWLKRSSV